MRRLRPLFAVLIFGLIAVQTSAQDKKAKPDKKDSKSDKTAVKPKTDPGMTEEQFRQTVFNIMQDPTGTKGDVYANRIIKFVDGTPKLQVVKDGYVLEWVGKEQPAEIKRILLAAYLGGNALSQMNSGVYRNDNYSGLLAMFRTYDLLKKHDSSLRCEDTEKLIGLHKEGRLNVHIGEMEVKYANLKKKDSKDAKDGVDTKDAKTMKDTKGKDDDP